MTDNIKIIAEAVEMAKEPKPLIDNIKNKPKSFRKSTLPDDCPVQPLGTDDGMYYYLDANQQLRKLAAGKHSRLEIIALFGQETSLLTKYWPRWKTDKNGNTEIVGWQPDLAAQALMESCAAQGLIDLHEAVRGAGYWKSEKDDLLLHCGDVLFCENKIVQPQKIGNFIYPADNPKPRPADISNTETAQELLDILKTWKWARQDIDPVLMLGWIGAALLGGALDWRPMVWVTGDKGTGKSTLQKIIKDILGRGGLISAVDASAAGLWQSLGHSCLPVALDEIEAEEDNRRNSNLIKLARCAASGGQMLRGGSDHKQSSFTIRSCFLFSSILIPPMLGQDISRMARLELHPLLKGADIPNTNEARLSATGSILRRRVLDEWPRFADTLSLYREAMRKAGHGGRGQDQFGTLLACADILLHEKVPDTDTLDEWAERMDVSTLNETADDIEDWQRCLEYLLSSTIEIYRNGTRKTISSWLLEAAGYKGNDEISANDALIAHGLKVSKKDSVPYLRIANSHRGLAKLFENTPWASRPGSSGVWVQSLKRAPFCKSLKGSERFGGSKFRAIEMPLDKIISTKGE